MTASALRFWRWCWPVQRSACDSRHLLLNKKSALIQEEIRTIKDILRPMVRRPMVQPVQRSACDSRHLLLNNQLLLIQAEIRTINSILRRMALFLELNKEARSAIARRHSESP
ncbi:MAG: hypothetical protein A2V67_11975 [Deltaproteobacteria bacterium RBG_13_61_14]|nr:MAG: hypothetical protein A2V67_11975 [Deltaproteobacteria bacterium RBG_13_61_14]